MNKYTVTVLSVMAAAFMGCSSFSATYINATVNKSNVNLRASDSVSASVVKRLKKDAKLVVIQSKGDWYKVDYQGSEGFIRKDMLNLGDSFESSSLPEQNDVAVLLDDQDVEILHDDSADDSILAGAYTVNVDMDGEGDSDDSDVPDEDEGILDIFNSDSNIVSGATSLDQIKTELLDAQTKLKKLGFYTGNVDGAFGAVSTTALKSFQKAYGLGADGVYGPASKSALEYASTTGGNGKSAANLETVHSIVSADWYNFMKTNIPKLESLLVVDVKTGTQFKLRPFATGSHADVEPPTKEDTQILYSVNGNKWAWTPRPVIVNVKGIWYAAAINVQPHGPDTLPDNGMDGQICMHFTYSRQHNTGDENKNMQEAVDYALKNGSKVIPS